MTYKEREAKRSWDISGQEGLEVYLSGIKDLSMLSGENITDIASNLIIDWVTNSPVDPTPKRVLESNSFNHNSGITTEEACGLEKDTMAEKSTQFIRDFITSAGDHGKESFKVSEFVEQVENHFSPRELSFLAGLRLFGIMEEAREAAQTMSPLLDMLKRLRDGLGDEDSDE